VKVVAERDVVLLEPNAAQAAMSAATKGRFAVGTHAVVMATHVAKGAMHVVCLEHHVAGIAAAI